MEALAGLAAVLVGVGAVFAAVATDDRFAVLGVTVALLAAPLVGTTWPDPLPLAFREVAVLTGAYVLWIAARVGQGPGIRQERSSIGLFVVIAFVAGAALASALGPGRVSVEASAGASAAALSAVGLGIAPPDRLARGLSAVMITLASALAATGLSGTGGSFEHVVMGAALLAVSAAAALVATRLP